MSAHDPAATALFYRMSAERLRTRCLACGAALLVSFLVPFEVIAGRGVFVWNVLGELTPAAQVAALAPAAAGLLLLVASLGREGRGGLVIRKPTSRAIFAIALFLAVNGAVWIGRRSSAWSVLPLPDSLITRPAPLLGVFALTAAGSVLRFHPPTRRAGAALLVASIACAIAFYLWPSRGEIPAEIVGRAIVSIATLPDVRFQIGYSSLLLLVLSPLVIALLGLIYVRGVPRREHPGLAILAVWGTPALVLLFVYRAFLVGGGGPQALATAYFALLLAAVVASLASAVEVLAIGVIVREADLEADPGMRPAVSGGLAAAIVAVFLGALVFLGRPAPKGVAWNPGAPSPGWDKALGELLPRWDRARLARDEHARHERGTGAGAQVAAKARARDLVAAARAEPNGAELAAALERLASEVDDLELSGRAFARLVGDANDAARRADLPYYLDPSVWTEVSEEGMSRHFRVTPYHLHEVHGWKVGDSVFATLVVEPMTGDRHVHLGFSRDHDPFALVVRSEIARHAGRFGKGEDGCDGPCETAAAALRTRLGADLEAALFRSTERHELEHQIDGPHLPLSSAVAELMAGFSDEAQDRANRELSAYIAEMTAQGAVPQLTLVHLYPFGVGRRRGAEHRVAVLLLETLAGKKLRFGARDVDTATFVEAFEEQVRRDDDGLRAAARTAYRAHFGADVPVVERETAP